MNSLLLVPPFLLAIYVPKVGNLAAYGGAFATMLVVYILPIVTYLKFKKSTIRNPELAKSLRDSSFVSSPPPQEHTENEVADLEDEN